MPYILFIVIRTIIEIYPVTKFATCNVIVQVNDVVLDYWGEFKLSAVAGMDMSGRFKMFSANVKAFGKHCYR